MNFPAPVREGRRAPSILLALATASTLAACAPEPIRGQLVDFRSGEPIAGATVTITQRGWGLEEGELLWDRRYSASTRTQAQGRFEIRLPAPHLAGRTGTLEAAQEGYQRLTEVPAQAGEQLLLQTLPVPAWTVPGGLAVVGRLADGRLFGWSFIENRPTTDRARADLFPERLERQPLRLVLGAPGGGGVLFLSRAAQGIATPSHGHLLRYAEEAPATGYGARVPLEADSPGTVFVRTRDDRHAKLGFDPPRLVTLAGRVAAMAEPVEFGVQLPFAYNPRPGRALPFDPAGPVSPPERSYAAAAAEIPPGGVLPRVARSYELTVRDAGGTLIDRVAIRLEPGAPQDLACARTRFRYRDVELGYGADGLPRVKLSVHGERFAFHGGETLVSRRAPARVRFHDHGSGSRPVEYELQLREVDEGAAGSGSC